ncbi:MULTISPECIES: hypothetical protein [unclassified Pseudomonas]|jgi:hypothetical protein|uniref:hypothetical protein n=1 Tax=unclassified Pseudomonas TaxID=196821 RepID=UPI0011A4D192|nr:MULTISPECIES: hypothetical protein [unclassified Pseudomonas]TWC26206.1 hypothetical protein FBY05_102258 [Pseudomonas sp. SJZ083]TWC52716.1 hypothetical protein FBY01_102387 [Pseudomonas sp. SJZ077]
MKAQQRFCFFMLATMLGLFSISVQAASSSATLCPSKEFTKFLVAFTESSSVQEEFTNLPLKKIITVDAEPEPKQEAILIEKMKIVFPVIPDKKRREETGLKLQVLDSTSEEAAVKLEKPDTDYQVIYVFKFSSCWFLDEVKDYSL